MPLGSGSAYGGSNGGVSGMSASAYGGYTPDYFTALRSSYGNCYAAIGQLEAAVLQTCDTEAYLQWLIQESEERAETRTKIVNQCRVRSTDEHRKCESKKGHGGGGGGGGRGGHRLL